MDKQEYFQIHITLWGNTRYELYVSSQTLRVLLHKVIWSWKSGQVKEFQKNQPFPLHSNCKIGEIKCVHLFLTNKIFELFVVCLN